MRSELDFVQAMRQAGLTPPADIAADKWTRFPGIGQEHNHADAAGWCKLFAGGRAGVYGDWRQGINATWFDNKVHSQMSLGERAALQKQIKVEFEEARQQQARSHARCAKRAREIWESATGADDEHPYLQDRCVKSYGLRCDTVDGSLIVPVYQPDGEISSLQFIGRDGHKRFMPDGKVKQGHFWLGQPGQITGAGTGALTLLVAEGYSTAASLHEATGFPVCVSFNAGNLLSVCQQVRQTYAQARIVVAGDDDHENAVNIGRSKAQAAAKAIGAELVFPCFTEPDSQTDFNDLRRLDGLEAVRQQLLSAAARLQRLRSLPIAELLALPASHYRVKSILPARGLAAVIGQSGAGKTFLSLDLAMSIARGQSWFGYRVKPCGVVYLAAEGEFGIARRILAYLNETASATDMPLEVIPFPANLLDSESDVQAVLGAWEEARARMGSAAVLMVDTLSRCMAGGDENSASDMTRFIANIDKIRRGIDGLVVVVHHLGKDVSKGARGHSSFYASLDACISVSRESQRRSWALTKARESEDGEEFGFDLKSVVLGTDEDGDPITSCVIDAYPVSHRAQKMPMPKGTNQKMVFKIASGLLQNSPHLGKGLASVLDRCIRVDDLIEACQSSLPIEPRRIAERVRETVKALVANGVLHFNNGWLWLS